MFHARTICLGSLGLFVLLLANLAGAAEAPDFETQVAPVLTKYCAGCHNSEEAEGELLLDSFVGINAGGESGAVIAAGDSRSSRMIGVLTGRLEPSMPPEDEPAPTEEEIGVLAAWIDAGAKGPAGSHPIRRLMTPKVPSADAEPAVTSLAFSPSGEALAIARFGAVELSQLGDAAAKPLTFEHPGKVQSVRFANDGKSLLTATGVTGLYGEARLWNVVDGSLQKVFPGEGEQGHADMVYAAVASPEGHLLATAGYDRKIMLWDVETGKLVRTLGGHNGAVYDLAFTADGNRLASASADATVKLWQVETGQRLDTRSEPLKEQLTTAISPDGTLMVGGGEDSRIRVWRLVATDQPEINPLLMTRFAHEGSIYLLRFSEDGKLLVSAGADGEVKLWETKSFRQIHSWPNQPASVQAVAISTSAGQVAVGRMDGSFELYPLPSKWGEELLAEERESELPDLSRPIGVMSQLPEVEPNDSPDQAFAVAAPVCVRGTIDRSPAENGGADVDFFRFGSQANQTWIIEVKAARDKSPLDSHIEVLTADGHSIPRVVLQATSDSYFAFRGKDSSQDGDFRLHNWREMHLNEYLYCNGEVVKFFYYPRGPDSGFNVFSSYGKRRGFFDTTPITHSLNESCYIVEPHAPGVTLVPNGLPTFVLNYENDDDSLRRFGDDSFLTFTAPEEGDYVVRVCDVRGLEGRDYRYELCVRSPEPDFKIKSVFQEGEEVIAGTGHKFKVTLDRIDGFDGPVMIFVDGLPAGFTTHSPLLIDAGQLEAWGSIYAASDAVAPVDDAATSIKLTAVAEIDGREVRKWPFDYGKIVLKPERTLQVEVAANALNPPTKDGIPVLEIVPGTTAKFVVRATRTGYQGRVSFGSQNAAINAPFGVFVDDIGLNGLQLQEDETERVASLTAEPWVEPQERLIYVSASEGGKPTSKPILLRVLSSAD